MRAGALVTAALAMGLAACGGTSHVAAHEVPPAERETCIPPDGEEEGIDGTEPAHPIAVGPDGPVTGLRRELDGSALYVSDSGVCSVAETAPGTWALTSLVLNARDEPVPGATVSLDALEPRGLHVLLVTRTDQDGSFAFVNVPVAGARTCYRTRVTAPGFLPYTDVDVVTPEPYAGNIWLSRDEYEEGLSTDRRGCVVSGAP